MSFTLRSVFLAFVVIAASLGTFGPWGLVPGLLVVACVVLYRSTSSVDVTTLVAITILAIALPALVLPSGYSARDAGMRARCENNLKQLVLALHNYELAFGTFPPAYLPGPDGTPWHSWRVLILPFIESNAIYDAYDFDEPWNGPNNSKLAAVPFSCYVCPTSAAARDGKPNTSYFAVVGPDGAWPGAKGRRAGEFPDGTGGTIFLVEATNQDVCWLEPRDLQFDAIVACPDSVERVTGPAAHANDAGLFCCTGDGVLNVAMVDGTVRPLPTRLTGKQLAPLLTVAGGENVDPDEAPYAPEMSVSWPHVLALVVLIVSSVLFCRSTSIVCPMSRSGMGRGG